MVLDNFKDWKMETFSILDKNGKVTNKEKEPKIDNDTLVKMYKTMVYTRMADEQALKYQRQGRMLTFAPVKGQEAAQVGPMAASDKGDWLVPAFREMAAMLYKGVPLQKLYLYWYGNEQGSHFGEGSHILPVNVPIGSQVNHAAGIAYASKLKESGEAVIAFIGDGGTSHGEFHEGMNFAGVFDLPLVTIIQNNHYAISTPRSKQTKAASLAQKAHAYGIPGALVDGNDPLAMYVVTKAALERAKKGEGPTLIEALTYRLGPHTTSDDPTIYRSDEEVEEWKKKDPIIRMYKYLSNRNLWNKEKEETLRKDYKKEIQDTFKAVEKLPAPTLDEVFDYTYTEMPEYLQRQKEARKAQAKSGGDR